ncbi:MAG: hypothetical protein GQ540_03345 [Lutibacter sp.]|nr:hypothetical protein [Lutibacter sp.]NOR27547.1 hypothetical protein [Lutibacter sp.]
MLLSDPPQIEMICCHCGWKDILRITQGMINPKQHGKFMPVNPFGMVDS